MVELFIKILLRPGSNEDGLFGRTSAYYGTVEAQGRLTLHLHLLLWIENSLSPQEIRDKLLGNDAEFKKALVDWLESCHRGEYCTGTMEEISKRIAKKQTTEKTNTKSKVAGISCIPCEMGDPTLCLPLKVPDFQTDEEIE